MAREEPLPPRAAPGQAVPLCPLHQACSPSPRLSRHGETRQPQEAVGGSAAPQPQPPPGQPRYGAIRVETESQNVPESTGCPGPPGRCPALQRWRCPGGLLAGPAAPQGTGVTVAPGAAPPGPGGAPASLPPLVTLSAVKSLAPRREEPAADIPSPSPRPRRRHPRALLAWGAYAAGRAGPAAALEGARWPTHPRPAPAALSRGPSGSRRPFGVSLEERGWLPPKRHPRGHVG
nr:nutritionally-regulated adipose and cardiac enriched protein homolog isoform X1 [Dasypus novemcinctus]